MSNSKNFRNDCKIIPDYMSPYPGKNTKPTCVVYHPPTESFLRFFGKVEEIENCNNDNFCWDMYGTDFKQIEIADRVLSFAPEPIGKPYFEFTIRLNK